MTITEFQGPHRFLSNFWIEPDGTCVEVEYQRIKTIEPEEWDRFKGVTPGQAKRLGRTVTLRTDWGEVKIPSMRVLVKQKFLDHPNLAEQLKATGDAPLIEGNKWHDNFWGSCSCPQCLERQGHNWLGQILMEVRESL